MLVGSESPASPVLNLTLVIFTYLGSTCIFSCHGPSQALWWGPLPTGRGEEPQRSDLYALVVTLLTRAFHGAVARLSSWHGCWGCLTAPLSLTPLMHIMWSEGVPGKRTALRPYG